MVPVRRLQKRLPPFFDGEDTAQAERFVIVAATVGQTGEQTLEQRSMILSVLPTKRRIERSQVKNGGA